MKPPGISFGKGVSWVGCSQPELSRLARSADVTPLAVRVWLAALGRMDRTGHARFAPNELREVLGSLDTSTGEVRLARADSVSDAIKAAKRLGYVSEASTARCVVLHHWTAQRGDGAKIDCPIHAEPAV